MRHSGTTNHSVPSGAAQSRGRRSSNLLIGSIPYGTLAYTRGAFSNAEEAEAAIAEAKTVINLIVGLSIPGFDIADKATSK